MPHTLFISDLHLSREHTRSAELFTQFLRDVAPHAEALYILGDLFEYWAGDDDLDEEFNASMCTALFNLSMRDTQIFIMHGNRDFLMEAKLAAACNASLLMDPTLLNLYGTYTLITHGDALCTDDASYQQFRSMVRGTEWRTQFLAQPLTQRKAQIEKLRVQSEQSKRIKTMDIMDVNNEAVATLLRKYLYPRLIHGHTHRPARHLHVVDGRECERWVLGDWDSGSARILRCDAEGMHWDEIK
jgi:UDP-2,3-diacylglucosamine hydrolase